MSPERGWVGEETHLVLSGRDFLTEVESNPLGYGGAPELSTDFVVTVGARSLSGADVAFVDTRTLEARVPPGLELGTHPVTVTTPEGRRTTLAAAFTVYDATLRIVDLAGVDVEAESLRVGESLPVRARIDRTDRLVEPVSVQWSLGGAIGSLTAVNEVAATVVAEAVGAGELVATHSRYPADTVALVVVDGSLSLEDAPAGSGAPIGARTLRIGQRFEIHAVVRLSDGTVLVPSDVSWTVTGGIATLVPTSLSSVELTASSAGTGVVRANDTVWGTGTTGTLTVVPCSADVDCVDACHSAARCDAGRCLSGAADKDTDGDGFVDAACPGGTDCDDDPAACGSACAPGEPEVCDGHDNDCDPGTVDGEDSGLVGTACDGADADGCADDRVVFCDAGGPVCSLGPDACCGDGSADAAESCDDANQDGGDGCSPVCKVEPGWVCTGNPSRCSQTCGNGQLDPGEACDDGNLLLFDGCSSTCDHEPGFACGPPGSPCSPVCSDGRVVRGEACDDRNAQSDDGCVDCAIVEGWACGGEPSVCAESCGNTLRDAGEECEDGDGDAGDGCDRTCRIEAGWVCDTDELPNPCWQTCGDGVLGPFEECDDGGVEPYDGCSPTCRIEPRWACTGEPSSCGQTCGDGKLDPGEECDDARWKLTDGCASDCTVNDGWVCYGEPSHCVPL